MINKFLKIYRKKMYSPEKYARYLGATIGENCYISTKGFSTESYLISIGNNVRIAKNVVFFTYGGVWPFRKILGDDFDMFGKINIGDNVHIGEGVYILPGVTIGSNCIVGAASVVTKSIPDNTIAGGNPCKIIGNINEFLDRSKKLNTNTKKMSYEEKKNYLLNMSDELFVKK